MNKQDEQCPPLVSIVCITYNHERYIRDCLEGFLMQKTNFPIEILIHDDASTDSTADIIREYQKKRPDIIKPILQKENQYSKIGCGPIIKNIFSRCSGKYIALCEGDDFWTDQFKLQKQFDLFQRFPHLTFSATGGQVLQGDQYLPGYDYPAMGFADRVPYKNKDLLSLFVRMQIFFYTASVFVPTELCRKALDHPIITSQGATALGDALLFTTLLFLSRDAEFCILSEPMIVYRRQGQGATTSNNIRIATDMHKFFYDFTMNFLHEQELARFHYHKYCGAYLRKTCYYGTRKELLQLLQKHISSGKYHFSWKEYLIIALRFLNLINFVKHSA